MAKGLGLNQNQLDDLARLVAGLSMSQKDKELFALAFADKYEPTRELRFMRMCMIPGYEEDLNEDRRNPYQAHAGHS